MAAQLVLPLAGDRAQSDGFLVTDCNRDLVGRLLDWSRWPYHAAVLIGPAASGKTALGGHLAAEADALFVDDAHAREDEPLFHAWNRAQNEGRPVLFASHAPLAEWGVSLPDLLSRLNASQRLTIGPPDEEMAALLLQKRLAAAGVALADPIAHFAAVRVERSYAGIAALADRLDALALANRRPIGQKMVREALEQLFGTSDGTADA